MTDNREINRTILIVDDTPENIDVLKGVLKEQYIIKAATRGSKALEIARTKPVDLILLDFMMPEMDGYEVCRILKSNEVTSQIPVIMLTACLDMDVKLRCLRAGANDFLAKPVDNVELQLRVNNLLEFRRHAETRKWNILLEQSKATLEGKNRELEAALLEIERTQTQIIQQEKMASIGQMAAGVAHEINNPIGFISSNLGTLSKYMNRFDQYIALLVDAVQRGCSEEIKEEISSGRRRLKIDSISQDIHQLIEENIEGTERVKKIVRDLKSFSHSGGDEMVAANINECLESTINIVWNEIKYVATLNREFGDIPSIRCNPQQLSQVFLNLLVNSGHAIDKRGDITIRTWAEDNSIKIAISDTGCGIPPSDLVRIFDAFYTTKEVGKGTGLGLSISAEIVKKHNGEIGVESEVGKGTTFTVRLPVTD